MSTNTRERLGAELRETRQELGLGQRSVALNAGCSQALVVRAERGDPGVSLDMLGQIASSLGGELIVTYRRPVVVGRVDQADPAHALCVAVLRRELARAGLECATEQPVADGRVRGWIDLLAFDRGRERLIVVEVKTELRDVGGLERQINTYARTCLDAARALGWHVREVLVCVVVLATSAVDAAVLANRDAFAMALPVRGREALAALASGTPIRGRALLAIDPRRRGRAMFRSLRVDGRRTDAPYADYADFMRQVRTGRGARDSRAR
jgi:transcriptional regulator with XRE-family HTH domain